MFTFLVNLGHVAKEKGQCNNGNVNKLDRSKKVSSKKFYFHYK